MPHGTSALSVGASERAEPPAVAPAVPVAIIGIGCRFPGGADDPRSFWHLIAAGTDAVGDIPPERWRTEDFFDADPATPGRMVVRQGGFLSSSVEEFDAGFFGMPPREAAALDPQQRLLLEVTWEAFEDAGIPPSTTAGGNIGVYIGGFTFDTATLQLTETNRHLVSAATTTGVSMTMLAARLSYTFDWCGPSLTLDTACSSSLVAFHQACVALGRGECDLAVAGGVNVMVNPITTILMSKGQFLSPDARCKSFDARANGYARGEGAGIVVLKRLDAAERDGDHIYAVVRGTAVNQDGRTPGITVPSVESQRALIRLACGVGGVEPNSVGYFEAHGTGTAVGDPIEATAIGEVVGDSDRTHWIGSVKSNFGHTEAAAGIAGVIKASLCLEHDLIPPNLHFDRPNPAIPFDRLPLRVPTRLMPFPTPPDNGPRRSGVNSFGFGGTNAHAILEQAAARLVQEDDEDASGAVLLPVSARNPQALSSLVGAYATLLECEQAPSLRRVGRAAARQRDHHALRGFVVAADRAEAVRKLRTLEPTASRAAKPGVVFVYTGMGPQWWGMGRELFHEERRFAEVIVACDEVLARYGISMADELVKNEHDSRLTKTLYAQVGNFVVQAGLTALWQDWGIVPDAIIGHSVGEVAAAYVAGVYSLEDALAVSFHRADLQSRLDGRGAMAAVGISHEDVLPHLVPGVCVAAVNSATATTLSGDHDAVAEVARRLSDVGVSVRHLLVDVAYHSQQMDEIREPLVSALRGIRPSAARVPLFSTVSGKQVDGPELDASYWWSNVRQPVLFHAAFRGLLSRNTGVVVEIGPHPVLASAIDEVVADRDITRVASQRRDRPQRLQMLEALGAVYVAGAEPCWERVHPGPREHLDLPRYPWQREQHWIESQASRQRRLGADGSALAGRPVASVTPANDIELAPAAFPYLADHRIGEMVIFPGSGYLEAALEMFPAGEPCFLDDVVLHRPLVLPSSSVVTLRASYDPTRRHVTMHSRATAADTDWSLHAELRRTHLALPAIPDPRTETLAELTEGLPEIGHDQVYARLADIELNYGPAFRGVNRLWHRQDTGEVFGDLLVDTVDQEGYRLHPAVLDAALQAMIVGALLMSGGGDGGTFVPVRIDQLRFFQPPGSRLWVHGRDRRCATPGRLECDLTLVTDDGAVVAEVTGLRAQRLARADRAAPSGSETLYYEHRWLPQSLDDSGNAKGAWIVVGSGAMSVALARRLVEAGGTVDRVEPGAARWPDQVAVAVSAASVCRGVVFLDDPRQAEMPACFPAAAVLELVQALRTAVPLFLVTTGAQSVSVDDPTTAPFAASIWGLGRVVCAERPELRCRLIDLAPRADHPVDELVDELTHDGLDDVALRPGVRYVRRLVPAGGQSPLHHVRTRADWTPVRLTPGPAGGNDLRLTTATRREPGAGQVELEVSHVGLNFKDVLKTTDLLAPWATEGTHSGRSLGMECSGTVIWVGSDVTDLAVGDEVFAHSGDLFASHVTLDAVRVVKKPPALSLAQAASLFPVATAYVCLVRLAGVRRGDRVLVHSAAGGVGLAAVRIATALGAEVYATAGSEPRRRYLRGAGVTHVTDSRSTAFADDVLAWTNGEGVDVILNSLPGEMIHHSLRVLRTFGRFIELGKPTNVADPAVSLVSARRAISFHSVDYDQMMALDPVEVRRCMRSAANLVQDGVVPPLPVTEVPVGAVEVAFRSMSKPEHHGKIAVRFARQPVVVPASAITEPLVRSDRSYVITGGLGGLGRTVARWLTDRGARHLTLVGRSGIATPEAEQLVSQLFLEGVTVRVEQVDVADRAEVAAMLARVRAQSPPINGVVHAAADFDDVVLARTSPARLVLASGPKAEGAWNLHLESRADKLDFFVLFSSMAAQLGAAGAGAYATANEFLNGLARHRHGFGLPAVSIGWGMIDEVGVAVKNDGRVGALLRHIGQVGMSPAQFLTELETVLRTRPVELTVADIDWKRWAAANPQLALLPRFRDVVPVTTPGEDNAVSAGTRLHEASEADRATLLPALVVPLLSKATGLSDEQLLAGQAVDVDSLTAVELRVLVQKEIGVMVPAVKMQQNLTVSRLAELLAAEFEHIGTETRQRAGLTVHEFVSTDGLTVYGHLSLPAGQGPHPAVVVCTAGEGGALDTDGNHFRVTEHAPLNAAGFAVFTIDHRGAPGHGEHFSAQGEMGGREIEDVVAGARHLAAMPEIDGTRLSIVGTSRGAYSALLAVSRAPSLWHRAALLMGMYDPALVMTAEASWPGAVPFRQQSAADETAAYFAEPQRQPLLCLDKVTVPLLVVHGDADPVIPYQQSVDLTDRARRLGVPLRHVAVPGLAHDSEHADEAWHELWPDIAEFLGEAS